MLRLTIILFLLTSQVGISQHCPETLLQNEIAILEQYNRSSNPKTATNYADSLLIIVNEKSLNNCKARFWISLKKGESYELAFNFENAAKLYYDLLEEAERLGYWDVVVELYICLARIDEFYHKFSECENHLTMAKELIEKHHIDQSMGHYTVRYSSFNRFFGSMDTAKYYAELAIKLGESTKQKKIEADGNLLMGMMSNDFDKSIAYYKKASDIFKTFNSSFEASLQLINIAKKFLYKDRYEEANVYLNEALALMSHRSNTDKDYNYLLFVIYEEKKGYFHRQNMLDSAYFYSELSHKHHIQANLKAGKDKVDQIEMQQEIEKEKSKVVFLEKQRTFFQWALILGGLAISILAWFFFINIRNRRRIDYKNQIIKSKNNALEKSLTNQTTLLSEIHHRVKNNLQLIISLLLLQSQKSEDYPIRSQLEEIASKVRSIALIHEQLYQKNEFDTIELHDYFDKLFSHFQQLKPFDYTIECNDISLNLETILPLGIISTELINNSIKYGLSDTPQLRLQVTKEKEQYKLRYQDNGLGYHNENLDKSKPGMGSMLIFSMIRQLNGDSRSYNQNGAIFELSFKQKQISDL